MALVEIAVFDDAFSGSMARARLAAEGIESVLFDSGISSMGFGMLTPARLMVDEDDRAEAEQVLARQA
jgi:fatty acid-binding protein DegV